MQFFNFLTLNSFFQGFQDSASPIMEGIVDLHNHVFFYLVLVLCFVMWVFSNVVYRFFYLGNYPQTSADLIFREDSLHSNSVTHGTVVEIIWTIIPSLVLVAIAIPSFALLYAMDEVVDPAVTLKAIGHQWYWSYEYSDYNSDASGSVAFDSYMLPEDDLQLGDFRLLEVDNEVVLPVNTHVRIIVSAVDVLHSWAVPSLGVKIDAVPGRLNQINLFVKRQGVFYGQCSELCGVNHGFMPIVVRVVSLDTYAHWLLSQN
jgi:cytochrome c oxidase subunit 2